MPDSNFDSMQQLLHDIQTIYDNANKYCQMLAKAVASTSDVIELTLDNADGTQTKIQIPSFAAIEQQIAVLERNVKALTGAGTGAADNSLYTQIVDEFGKVKTLVRMSLLNVPEQIDSLQGTLADDNQVVALGNDLSRTTTLGLNVQIDVTGHVSAYMKQCQVTKFIFDSDKFDALTKVAAGLGRELTHKELLAWIDEQDLKLEADYDIEDFTVNLRPRRQMSQGAFNVLNQKLVGSNVLQVRLDDITYSNIDAKVEGSQTLKVGDLLATATGDIVFSITQIDVLSNTLTLLREAGLQMPAVSLKKLVYCEQTVRKCVDVPLRYNERFALLLSPIHDAYDTIANYSPVLLIDITKLTIRDEDNQLINANSYALSHGDANIGSYLEAIATDMLPPAKYAVKPDTLALTADMFKVIQLNTHLTDNVDKEHILQLYSQKRALKQDLSSLDSTIASLQLRLNTQNYANEAERKNLQTEYLSYSRSRAQKLETLNAVIDEMLNVDANAYDALFDPKYRVRGFVPVQLPSVSRWTSPQNVIQFKIQYRYVSMNGVVAKADTFDVLSDNAMTTAVFSSWNEVFSPLRHKVVEDGQVHWERVNVSSIDSITCNQIDIPITPNEQIQIRIKAIGEAGYPNVLNESEWSNIITIGFPDSLAASAQFVALKDELLTDKQTVLLEGMLQSKGVIEHIADSITENQIYFAHAAQNLASGFFSENMLRVSVYQKLLELSNQVTRLQDIIINEGSMLRISIIDEDGVETEVANGTSIVLYAGAYSSVFNMQSQDNHGAILQKQYAIKFTNIGSQPISLYPKVTGSLDMPVDTVDADFRQVPIAIINDTESQAISVSEWIDHYNEDGTVEQKQSTYHPFVKAPIASRQAKGQILYAGMKNVKGTKDLWMLSDEFAKLQDLSASTDSQQKDAANLLTLGGGVQDSDSGKYVAIADGSSSSVASRVHRVSVPSDFNMANIVTMTTSHALYQKFASIDNLDAVNRDKAAQAIIDYLTDLLNASTIDKSEVQAAMPQYYSNKYADAPVRCMYSTDSDIYNVGSTTRGAHLVLNPTRLSDIQVGSSAESASLVVNPGTNNIVTVPMLFQARMSDAAGNTDKGAATSAEQFSYAKTLNLQCWIAGKKFEFDVKVYADYKSNSSILGVVQ